MKGYFVSACITLQHNVTIGANTNALVGGLRSYLHYLCLFANIGVQHILCCVFVLFVFVLCALCCQFLWIVHFVLPFDIL